MKIETVSSEAWNKLVAADPSATFFQTPAWHAMASRHFGTETLALKFSFGDVEAIIPLQRQKKKLWSLYTSPFGTYTALVCGHKLQSTQLEQIQTHLRSLNLDLSGSPFTLNPISVGREYAATTQVLELESISADRLTEGWNRNHRRNLEAGREAGISIRLADKVLDMEAYSRIYQTLAESWGDMARTIYPGRLFQMLWETLGKTSAMKVWLAECEGAMVAGRICFYHGSHVVEWHAAALDVYRQQGANHVLIHSILKDAKSAGYRIYDFNPNPNLPQVDHFKSGFGTRRLAFKSSRNSHGLYSAIEIIRGRRHG